MKSSRTNSFRLTRISRASSLRKQSQTFYLPDETVKFSAINSVARGVKHSQLSFLTGEDLNKLRKQPCVTSDNFYESAHVGLTEVRRKYDDIKKQKTNIDENIIKLKAQIRKYRTIEDEYLGKKNEGSSQVENLQSNLNSKILSFEQTLMQKKVLQNMRNRLKIDKVVYDQRKFNMEKQFSFQKKQKTLLQKDGMYTDEQNSRIQKIQQKLKNQISSQQKQRDQHIRNLQNMIEQKQRCTQHNFARGQEIYQIAERALQDKDPTQKQWHKIYLTHVFVSKMLRNKIDKQMQKFSTVQFAFKNIKTATGVSNAKTLINKYLNKQAQYGDLLGRITINQKKIVDLKQQRQFLLEQQKQLQMQKQTMLNLKAKYVDISDELKQYMRVSDHQLKMQTYINKISTWLYKLSKKLNSIQKNSVSFSQSKTKNQVKQNFIQLCKIITSILQKLPQNKELDDTTNQISTRDYGRVVRVAPKKSRKNSVGQQIFDVEEQQIAPQNQYEQKQIVNMQREELIKTNQKFMKDARKRLQEKRKLLSEKHVDKNTKKVQEIKKQQQD